MKEIWKPIPTWEGLYSVSNFGRIKSDRYASTNSYPGKILKQSKAKGRRPMISLEQGKRKHARQTARIVAEVFLGKCPNHLQVNHLDGNKLNNHADNLEYITPEENVRHRVQHHLAPCGEKHHYTKITSVTVREIRNSGWTSSRFTKPSTYDLAKQYNLSATHIHEILIRKTWKHLH